MMTVCRASAGTGKTFTLAANYVALLLSGNSYRSILAVTFTNKATAEMRDRILLFLDLIARGADDGIFAAVRRCMRFGADAPEEQLRQRAAWCYKQMLEDYDNIHISTIDTFLLQLLNGLGQLLDDATAGAAVELDLQQLLIEAVDRLLTEGDALSGRLELFVRQRLHDGQSWDIRQTLIAIAKQVYTEYVQQADAAGQIVFDPERIDAYRAKMDWRQSPKVEALRSQLLVVRGQAPAEEKVIERLQKSLTVDVKDEDMFRGFTDKQRIKLEADGRSELLRLDDLAAECRREYLTCSSATSMLKELSLMTVLRDEVRLLLVERNRMLLAQTADKLHRALASGDADFILEKAGIRYHHVLLDEFQDTSVLQWQNFKPLLEDILASGGTVFIVGDIKQSIYRWRNGDWTIMANLDGELMPLSRNYRSSREVVQFNLELFKAVTASDAVSSQLYDEGYERAKLAAYCKPDAPAGYVQFYAVDCPKREDEKRVREHILHEMFSTINTLLQQGATGSDILILTRGHKEAEWVIDYYRTLGEEFASVQKTPIVSCDSFHLDASPSVRLIITMLRWAVLKDNVAKAYVEVESLKLKVESLKGELPLMELLEEAVKLVAAEPITDIAYVNSLLDYAHDYVRQHGSDAAAFLTYWDDILHAKAIAAPERNAMRILTVHSSKGLEGKNVFVPFCNWPLISTRADDIIWCKAPEGEGLIPVRSRKTLAESAFADDYERECALQRIDNINLLYVALTRAGKRLFAYSPVNFAKSDENSVGTLMYSVLAGQMTDYKQGQIYRLGELLADDDDIQKKEAANDVSAIVAQLHTGEREIEFRMSRESVDSLRYGAVDANRQAQVDLGNLCHGILENAETIADIAPAIEDAKLTGLIADAEAEAQVTALINAAWTNERMRDWFSGRWEIWREATFLTENGEQRPDRVMIDPETKKAIVLDYKFGKREPQYAQQVRSYMRLLVELGYTQVEGWLWYAQEAALQEVRL